MRLWKDFLRQLARDYAGNRVVFSCRHLDYSVTLSSKDLPVPQVRIEPLSDAQVQEFLTLYCPEHSATLWQNLQGTPQLDLLRSPYYLKLLVAQTTAGRFRLAGPPCSRALYDRPYGAKWRVITRCFGDALHVRDVQRLVQGRTWPPFELPESGILFQKLSALAFQMQTQRAVNEAAQVRIAYDEALALLDHPRAEDMLKAGAALGCWMKTEAAMRCSMYTSYSRSTLRRGNWHVSRRRNWCSKSGVLIVSCLVSRPRCTTWPMPTHCRPCPARAGGNHGAGRSHGANPERFLTDLMVQNLALAGRCAAQPEVALSDALKDKVRWALVERTQDPGADLRAHCRGAGSRRARRSAFRASARP